MSATNLHMHGARILQGDARSQLRQLEAGSIRTCVTSPPYFGLRDYGHEGQIGLESTPDEYVRSIVEVFREVRRVLADDGTLWLNLGDSYANVGKWGGSSGGKHAKSLHGATGIGRGKKDYGDLKPKDLIGIPWLVAFALRADGWYLRQDIIWQKLNPMPESVKDRCTKAHEYLFLLSKEERYYFDSEAMKEPSTWGRENNPDWQHARAATNAKKHPTNRNGKSAGFAKWTPEQGRNKRSVWTVNTRPYKGAHFATFPPALIEPCVLAGSAPGDTVLDPFNGSGTTGQVALAHGRKYVGVELNPDYIKLTEERLATVQPGQQARKTPAARRPDKPSAHGLKPIFG